jgi:hypothetical protein
MGVAFYQNDDRARDRVPKSGYASRAGLGITNSCADIRQLRRPAQRDRIAGYLMTGEGTLIAAPAEGAGQAQEPAQARNAARPLRMRARAAPARAGFRSLRACRAGGWWKMAVCRPCKSYHYAPLSPM